MKKIISLVVFVVLLAWTWNLIHSEPQVSLETHAIIQQKLAEIIQNSIKTHRPTAHDFDLSKLWTENQGAQKVKAYFSYKFIDGEGEAATSQTVTGEAFLRRTTEDGSTQENWKIEKVMTSSNQVVFEEGTVITPEATSETDAVTTEGASTPGENATETQPEK